MTRKVLKKEEILIAKVLKFSDFVDREYKDFSKYVLKNRAIPNLIDGMKPVNRKLLYQVNKMASSKKMKTMAVAGSLSMINYNHGEKSASDALNGLARKYDNNINIIDGIGIFGSRLVPVSAAPRYTSVKLSPNFEKYFKDTNLSLESFDKEDPEPRYYLPLIPWILVNGIEGIAIGFSTTIRSRDPALLTKACKMYLSGKDISKIEFPPYYKGFNGTIEKIDGRWASIGVVDIKSSTQLEIKEVPIGYSRESYIKVLDGLVDKQKILKYTDCCSKTGFNFKIQLKRGNKVDKTNVILHLKLRKFLYDNITVITHNNEVKVYTEVYKLIQDFCDHRLTFYKIRYDNLILKCYKETELFVSKIKFVGLILDGSIVIKDRSKANLIEQMCNHKINQEHNDILLNISIYKMCNDEIVKWHENIKLLKKDISDYSNINYVDQYIKELQ